MKIGKFLPFLLVASLASCGSELNMGGRGLVKDGEKFEAARVQNVPEGIKTQMEGGVNGVKINSNIHMTSSTSTNGQSSSSEEWTTSKETYDFKEKKITMTTTSGGKSAGYVVQIVGDQIKYSFSGGATEEQVGFELTMKGMSEMLETSYKALFSWNFIPSEEDIQKIVSSMDEMYSSMGIDVTITGMDTIITQISADYVMSGDYEAGNFEVGFDKAHSYTFTMSMMGMSVSPTLTFSKMRLVFKNYMCVESYVAMREIMTMVVGEGEYSVRMTMNMYTETYSTYSYF